MYRFLRCFCVLGAFLIASSAILAGAGPFRITFDWKQIRSLSASKGGIGGVFFVGDDDGNGGKNSGRRLVVKYVTDVNGPYFAHGYLEAIGVQTPRSVPVTGAGMSEISQAIDRYRLLKKTDRRTEAVYDKTVPIASAVLLQELAGGDNLAELQGIFEPYAKAGRPSLSAAFATEYAPRFEKAARFLKVLASANQGKDAKGTKVVDIVPSLGMMFVADILLGNGDRLKLMNSNLSNVVMDGRHFVAIDNAVEAPSLADVAWAQGIREVDNYAISAPVGKKMAKSLQKTYTITADDWVAAILGPGSVENAVDERAAAKALAKQLKAVAKVLLQDVAAMEDNPKLMLVRIDKGKLAKDFDKNDVWKVNLATSYDAKKGHFHLSYFKIDWKDVEAALAKGIVEARSRAYEPAFLPFVMDSFGKILPGIPKDARMGPSADDIHRALDARTAYLKARVHGKRTVANAKNLIKLNYAPKAPPAGLKVVTTFEYYYHNAAARAIGIDALTILEKR